MTDVKTVEARRKQSLADKPDARALLFNKKPREKELVIPIGDDEVTLRFRAISLKRLDKLRAEHKPTAAQRAEGRGVNTDTFNPALVAATLIEPELTTDEVREIFNDDNWSNGEITHIYLTASEVCMDPFEVTQAE